MLVYLSDVEEGGETSFLLEGRGGLARLATIDYKACDTGIKVGLRALFLWPSFLCGLPAFVMEFCGWGVRVST